MLPKVARAKIPADFRPNASLRLLCKTFSYEFLRRIEATLDAHQPEEQHGFLKGRRVEEHLLTANLIIDKSFACNLPMWIISSELSKTFDRVDWDALWDALRHHGVRTHNLDFAGLVRSGQVRSGQVRSGQGGCFSWMNMPTLPCNLDACHVSF